MKKMADGDSLARPKVHNDVEKNDADADLEENIEWYVFLFVYSLVYTNLLF